MTTTTTTTLQVITNVEAQDTAGYTRGWIVPAGTDMDADADLELQVVDHVDIPATEDEGQWDQGLRDALAISGYALVGQPVQDREIAGCITAAVVRA